jgi:hypothetical protein
MIREFFKDWTTNERIGAAIVVALGVLLVAWAAWISLSGTPPEWTW